MTRHDSPQAALSAKLACSKLGRYTRRQDMKTLHALYDLRGCVSTLAFALDDDSLCLSWDPSAEPERVQMVACTAGFESRRPSEWFIDDVSGSIIISNVNAAPHAGHWADSRPEDGQSLLGRQDEDSRSITGSSRRVRPVALRGGCRGAARTRSAAVP